MAGSFSPDPEPGRHISELLTVSIEQAHARLELSEEKFSSVVPKLVDITNQLRQPNQFAVFLDHAFVSANESKHNTYDDHPGAASCCWCWDHRLNFDSLFDLAKDTPAKVGELVIAIAALGGRVSLDRKHRHYPNVAVGDARILIAIHDGGSDAFEKAYFKNEVVRVRQTPAIVLRAKRIRKLSGLDAARLPPIGSVDQTTAAAPELPRLYGSEFWEAVDAKQVLRELGLGSR